MDDLAEYPARRVDEARQRRLERLRSWSTWLDSRFRVPGTRWRIGLDPILGLFPPAGDIVSPIYGVALLIEALRLRIPAVVQVRMLVNVLLDVAVGLVPIAGDLFDAVYKVNVRNLRLLERHAVAGARPGALDYLVTVLLLGTLGAITILPVAAFLWIVARVGLI